VMLMLPGATFARTLNVANLDDGTCGQNLQVGSDKTASRSATPSFLLWGDGGASSYTIFIDGVSIGIFLSNGFANVCITTTTPLADGPHLLTGNELLPHSTYVITPFNFSVDTVPPPAPSPPVVSSYSDSGVLGDGITRYRNVNFTGTYDPSMSTSATGGNSTVALAWSAPVSDGGSAITGYRVYRGTSAGGETLLTTLAVVTSYDDTSAVNGTTYFYKVSAVNGVGEGSRSNECSATASPPATMLGAPSSLTATALSRSQIGLAWTDNATAETGFRIERSRNDSSDWREVATVAADVTAYTHARQPTLTTYSYRVRATNGVGDSAYSNVASATTLG